MAYRVFNATDFSQGYATDLAPEKMPDNMLQTAENVVWREGIVNRGGRSVYTTDPTGSTYTAIRGVFRGYLSTEWVNVYAIENAGGGCGFYVSTGNTMTSSQKISTGTLFTSGYNVEFAQLNDNIVAVNGYDRPVTIFTTGSIANTTVQPLDLYDQRTLTSWDWFAGSKTSGATTYVDHSTEAYGAGGFPVVSTVANTGFYLASPYEYSKFVMTSCSPYNVATTNVTYEYWTSGAFAALATTQIEQYPTWDNTTASRTMIWDYLPGWTKYESTDQALFANKYILRVSFPAPPNAAVTCQKIQVYDTHKLTRDMADDRPSKVIAHNSIVWLASGNNVYWSRPNKITDWNAILNAEYFTEGGKEITALASLAGYLLVFKEMSIYGFYGSYFDNPTKTRLSGIGSPYGRSVVQTGQAMMFLANDGIRLWTGSENILVSKHIRTDIEALTKAGACAVFYKGEYWLSFPQASTPTILVTDPDTFKRDDAGDGRVAFFKFTSCRSDQFSWHDGAGDDGQILAISNQTRPLIHRYDNGDAADNSTTAFTKKIRTRPLSFGKFQEYKNIRRYSVDLLPAGAYTFTQGADLFSSSTGIQTVFATSSAVGSHFSQYVAAPYQMDGKTAEVQIENATTYPMQIFGFAVEADVRRY